VSWCDQYLRSGALTGAEMYRMRCKVLHQGRAATNQPGRYSGFAFGQPAADGAVDHGRVDGSVLHLDVGELSREIRVAVESWFASLEASTAGAAAVATASNLQSLVRVVEMPVQMAMVASTTPVTTTPIVITITKTN
jgi:hypothetical protein